ncbi:MAG: isoprenylcysteine carboxylmethyltransferase family protein [Candidatus Promineofilum sp.]|nr:isoprenylcysteine carboxylmethyltransferase family protein [Promineifilum sp.]
MSLFTHPTYLLTLVIVLAIWATPDVLDSIRKHPKGNMVVVRDGGSHNFFRVGLSAAIIAAALLAHFHPQGTLPNHRPYLFVLGIALAFAGLALRRWAIGTLGRFFTVDVATFADQRVVDAPPYRRIRHPAYSGSILSIMGTTLMLGHWLGLLLVALAIVVTFGYRVRLEERALLEALGEPYAAYMRRTKRFVPYLW